MAKFAPVFNSTESAILLAMYEEANGHYDSYTLAWKLNPIVHVPSQKRWKRSRELAMR